MNNNGDGNKEKEQTNFWMDILKERMEIKRKSKEFKKRVDIVKKLELNRIEEESAEREYVINSMENELELALKEGDNDKIKELLKNFRM